MRSLPIGTLGAFALISPVFTSNTLHPINILHYETSIGLHSRAATDLSVLDPQNHAPLIYGTTNENNNNLLLANLTLFAQDGLPIVVLERFEELDVEIDCSDDEGVLTLRFGSPDTWLYAKKQWGDEGARGKFWCVALGDGCGDTFGQRQAYIISNITDDEAARTISLTATAAPWSDVAHSYNLDFGHAVTRQEAKRRKRGNAGQEHKSTTEGALDDAASFVKGDLDKNITGASFNISAGQPGHRSNVYTDQSAGFTLDCINCFMAGSFEVEGHIFVHDFTIQELELTASPKSVFEALDLEANIDDHANPSSLIFRDEIFTFPVPELGFSIPHIMQLGADLSYYVGGNCNFTGAANVDFGINATLPDTALIVADYENKGASQASGFESTQLAHFFNVNNASASMTLSAYSQPVISFEVSLTGIGSVTAAVALNLPELTATFTAEDDENGACTHDPGASKTGIEIDSEASITVDLDMEARLDIKKDEHEPWSTRLWSSSWPLPSTCYPVSIPGLLSLPTATPPSVPFPSATPSMSAALSGNSASASPWLGFGQKSGSNSSSLLAPFTSYPTPYPQPVSSSPPSAPTPNPPGTTTFTSSISPSSVTLPPLPRPTTLQLIIPGFQQSTNDTATDTSDLASTDGSPTSTSSSSLSNAPPQPAATNAQITALQLFSPIDISTVTASSSAVSDIGGDGLNPTSTTAPATVSYTPLFSLPASNTSELISSSSVATSILSPRTVSVVSSPSTVLGSTALASSTAETSFITAPTAGGPAVSLSATGSKIGTSLTILSSTALSTETATTMTPASSTVEMSSFTTVATAGSSTGTSYTTVSNSETSLIISSSPASSIETPASTASSIKLPLSTSSESWTSTMTPASSTAKTPSIITATTSGTSTGASAVISSTKDSQSRDSSMVLSSMASSTEITTTTISASSTVELPSTASFDSSQSSGIIPTLVTSSKNEISSTALPSTTSGLDKISTVFATSKGDSLLFSVFSSQVSGEFTVVTASLALSEVSTPTPSALSSSKTTVTTTLTTSSNSGLSPIHPIPTSHSSGTIPTLVTSYTSSKGQIPSALLPSTTSGLDTTSTILLDSESSFSSTLSSPTSRSPTVTTSSTLTPSTKPTLTTSSTPKPSTPPPSSALNPSQSTNLPSKPSSTQHPQPSAIHTSSTKPTPPRTTSVSSSHRTKRPPG